MNAQQTPTTATSTQDVLTLWVALNVNAMTATQAMAFDAVTSMNVPSVLITAM